MMNKLYTLKNRILILSSILIGLNSQGQDLPFNCDYNAYLFQYNDVYAIDLASGNAYEVATDITTGNINAAAYNSADGFIWGSLSTPSKTIVRIGKNFETTTLYIDELPIHNRYVGDISTEGIYYLKGGGTTYYKIDLNPDSANYGQYIETLNLSQSISHHDWAFNAVDNKLYTVEKSTNILYRIDAETGAIENLGEVPILSGLNYTYGAVYFDVSGRFYVSANQTGTIYVIQSVQDLDGANSMDSNLFAFGPSSSQNDGARCPTAPVPQEICDNGIDDDGDGLTDCEDPSCSGYGDCEVIDPPTSGGNDGGLESNNRLSNQINQRNYNRAKNSYSFDKANARKVKKTAKYAQRNSNLEFKLQDFIPLDVINEEYALESTPTDLLNITNATEVYSVDYMINTNTVASILALKTENGVYEHTKYICDRLLGGELISVSTIDINEQSFIKSIIRNTDNTVEFVLSLSAKEVNNNENFAIESHWNLDKYESDVTFYNFQIWSNSLDDLLLLGEEVVRLLNSQRPISSYNNSTPPTVFVRKGKYVNGKLDLQIINTNATRAVTFDAGLRETETRDIISESSTVNLNENYITNLEYDIGNLFDIGFRIGDGIATPDDLFMSDGPWGIDDFAKTTVINSYNILPNSIDFDTADFPIERNINLEATTSEYVAAYRALTPRFNPVNLTSYNAFKLKAKGTGNLQITFIKKGIDNWEDQYKTNIQLTDTLNEFIIPFSKFNNSTYSNLVLDDIVTIVFTMVSKDGKTVTKNMLLQDISFTQSESLSIESYDAEGLNRIMAIPNPMNTSTTIRFMSNTSETVQLIIHDQLGKVVYKTSYRTVSGKNEIELNKQQLSSGLYFCNMVGDKHVYNPLKLLIR
ncbi:T9SS type A sorting domain-containing protein [Pontimicrobium sp. SW4]|uniref:T9SS type A sorting domain-containing protein n=1 Tax=Pontimicrobium sp. SW4 TaxID=3153519 RepID=A0AAU7BTJ7_9FLAO